MTTLLRFSSSTCRQAAIRPRALPILFCSIRRLALPGRAPSISRESLKCWSCAQGLGSRPRASERPASISIRSISKPHSRVRDEPPTRRIRAHCKHTINVPAIHHKRNVKTLRLTKSSIVAQQRRHKPRLHLPLDHHRLDLGDGFRRIETLWAGLGAVHDRVAAIEPERVLEIVEPLT